MAHLLFFPWIWRATFKWNYKRTSWAKIQSEQIIKVEHCKRNKSKHDVIAYNSLHLGDGLELFYRRGAFYVNCFSVEAIMWKITKDDRHKAITRSSNNGLICQKISGNLCAHFNKALNLFDMPTNQAADPNVNQSTLSSSGKWC